MIWRVVYCLLLVGCWGRGEIVTVSLREDVSDAPLLDGEFAGWNFGASPLLEVGYMGGIYTEHRATSVIKFDLRGTGLTRVTGATMRLWKPMDFVQRRPIRVGIFPIKTDWEEGRDVFGKSGIKGTISATPTAASWAEAPNDRGAWVEFRLPAELVQSWVDGPETNRGVMLAVDDKEQKEWGDHAYFYSSEHWSEKTPRLVIDGELGGRRELRKRPAKQKLVELPAANELGPWQANNGRLAKFARNLECTPHQARLIQMFDTDVRDRFIVGRYQAPFQKVILELPALIERKDERAVRERLDRLHELLLKWEYIRETMWYTSGPLADVLTPKQLNRLLAGEIFGTMETSAKEKGRDIWRVLPPEKIAAHNRAVIKDLEERLQLTPAQSRALSGTIGEFETKENDYLRLFRADLARCQEMMRAGKDGPEVFTAVRDLHLHHERFLYYQSIYNTPRWTVLLRHAPVLPLAQWVAEVRKDHYDRAVSGATRRGTTVESED